MVDRVVWVSNETPDRGGQGGQRRQYFQIAALRAAGIDVEVVSLAGEQDDSSIREIAAVQRIVRGRRRPWATLRGRALIRHALAQRDIAVIVAHSESWPLVRRAVRRGAGAPVLVDLHNVWGSWYRARGEEESAADWDERERALTVEADALSFCSPDEAARLPIGGSAVRIVAPHGVDPQEWPQPRSRGAGAPRIGAFGNWWWEPNRDGVRWFLDEVWPLVRSARPDVRLRIAGAGLEERCAGAPGVDALGRVPELGALIDEVDVVVVPIRGGVGAPVKFAEALASGRPVVATTGASGGLSDVPARLGDHPDQWARDILHLLADPREAERLGRQGRRYAREELSWASTTAPIVDWIRRQRSR